MYTHTHLQINTHTNKPQCKEELLSRVWAYAGDTQSPRQKACCCPESSSYRVKSRTSATMSPFSACTWAMAPRSRITLNTSYTCSEKRDTVILMHKCYFFLSTHLSTLSWKNSFVVLIILITNNFLWISNHFISCKAATKIVSVINHLSS